MSIKGKSQELFIGKTEINIKDWRIGHKNKKILYENMSRIEYCFRTTLEGGYIDFYDVYGRFDRFSFAQKSNESIQRAVDYITEHYPDLLIERNNPNNDPFYTKTMFITVISLCCFWPVGLILYWCTGKRTLEERIYYTCIILAIELVIYFLLYWNYQLHLNQALDEINSYLDQANIIFN